MVHAESEHQQKAHSRCRTQVKSSGGVRLLGVPLGGQDTQYARGDIFPGVFRFVLELAATSERAPLPVAVLTARAREFRFALELREGDPVCAGFRSMGAANGYTWGVGPVLYGSVVEVSLCFLARAQRPPRPDKLSSQLCQWLFQERKGWRKSDNFERLVSESASSTQFVFIGDTGEGDEEAAERMLARHADRIAAVFLHVVSGEDAPPPSARAVLGRPICYFRTYAGAAAQALELGLIDRDAALRVAQDAERDLAGTSPLASKWLDLQYDAERLRGT